LSNEPDIDLPKLRVYSVTVVLNSQKYSIFLQNFVTLVLYLHYNIVKKYQNDTYNFYTDSTDVLETLKDYTFVYTLYAKV
jgi:hypothetical protein